MPMYGLLLRSYLFSIYYIHNNSSLQHSCQSRFDGKVGLTLLAIALSVSGVGGELGSHSPGALVVDHSALSLGCGNRAENK